MDPNFIKFTVLKIPIKFTVLKIPMKMKKRGSTESRETPLNLPDSFT